MTDHDTQLIDAMCLIECLSFGECKKLYDSWDHGIYEFRDRVSILSAFAHECWLIVTGDDHRHCDFDAEFCPLWLAKFMRLGMENPEFLTVATGRRFAREILADLVEAEKPATVTISRDDLGHLIELAEIRRDQWRGDPDCDMSPDDDAETKSFMAGLIDELITRVSQ